MVPLWLYKRPSLIEGETSSHLSVKRAYIHYICACACAYAYAYAYAHAYAYAYIYMFFDLNGRLTCKRHSDQGTLSTCTPICMVACWGHRTIVLSYCRAVVLWHNYTIIYIYIYIYVCGGIGIRP